jgi:RNA polymerase sigma-70 factor (ECF subfamily)
VTDSATEFDTLFTQHADFVWRVLARHGVRELELEDACQEVFLIVFAALERFEGRSTLKTWIYGICRKVAANSRRRAAHRRELALPEVLEEAATVAASDAFEALACKQSAALLVEFLDRMPAEQREVFVLYEIEELAMRDIADSLGCPLQTAFSRLYAARRSFTTQLERERHKRRVA